MEKAAQNQDTFCFNFCRRIAAESYLKALTTQSGVRASGPCLLFEPPRVKLIYVRMVEKQDVYSSRFNFKHVLGS